MTKETEEYGVVNQDEQKPEQNSIIWVRDPSNSRDGLPLKLIMKELNDAAKYAPVMAIVPSKYQAGIEMERVSAIWFNDTDRKIFEIGKTESGEVIYEIEGKNYIFRDNYGNEENEFKQNNFQQLISVGSITENEDGRYTIANEEVLGHINAQRGASKNTSVIPIYSTHASYLGEDADKHYKAIIENSTYCEGVINTSCWSHEDAQKFFKNGVPSGLIPADFSYLGTSQNTTLMANVYSFARGLGKAMRKGESVEGLIDLWLNRAVIMDGKGTTPVQYSISQDDDPYNGKYYLELEREDYSKYLDAICKRPFGDNCHKITDEEIKTLKDAGVKHVNKLVKLVDEHNTIYGKDGLIRMNNFYNGDIPRDISAKRLWENRKSIKVTKPGEGYEERVAGYTFNRKYGDLLEASALIITAEDIYEYNKKEKIIYTKEYLGSLIDGFTFDKPKKTAEYIRTLLDPEVLYEEKMDIINNNMIFTNKNEKITNLANFFILAADKESTLPKDFVLDFISNLSQKELENILVSDMMKEPGDIHRYRTMNALYVFENNKNIMDVLDEVDDKMPVSDPFYQMLIGNAKEIKGSANVISIITGYDKQEISDILSSDLKDVKNKDKILKDRSNIYRSLSNADKEDVFWDLIKENDARDNFVQVELDNPEYSIYYQIFNSKLPEKDKEGQFKQYKSSVGESKYNDIAEAVEVNIFTKEIEKRLVALCNDRGNTSNQPFYDIIESIDRSKYTDEIKAKLWEDFPKIFQKVIPELDPGFQKIKLFYSNLADESYVDLADLLIANKDKIDLQKVKNQDGSSITTKYFLDSAAIGELSTTTEKKILSLIDAGIYVDRNYYKKSTLFYALSSGSEKIVNKILEQETDHDALYKASVKVLDNMMKDSNDNSSHLAKIVEIINKKPNAEQIKKNIWESFDNIYAINIWYVESFNDRGAMDMKSFYSALSGKQYDSFLDLVLDNADNIELNKLRNQYNDSFLKQYLNSNLSENIERKIVSLIEKGCTIDSEEPTLLVSAIEVDSQDVVRKILEKDNSADYINKQSEILKRTALMTSVSFNRVDILGDLLKEGNIDVNIQDYAGKTALSLAAQQLDKSPRYGGTNPRVGHEMVSLLVEHPDRYGVTNPRVGHEMVSLLVEHPDTDLNIKDNEGKTALDWALWSGNFSSAEILIEAGALIGEEYTSEKNLQKYPADLQIKVKEAYNKQQEALEEKTNSGEQVPSDTPPKPTGSGNGYNPSEIDEAVKGLCDAGVRIPEYNSRNVGLNKNESSNYLG